MIEDLVDRLYHYGYTLDRATEHYPILESLEDVSVGAEPNRRRVGGTLVRGVCMALVGGVLVILVLNHPKDRSPVALSTAPDTSASKSVPDTSTELRGETVAIVDADWPLVQVESSPDGSIHLRFTDRYGKAAAASELGGGALDIWTGSQARQLVKDKITAGVYGSPRATTVVGRPATMYYRESYSYVVVWSLPDGTDAALKLEGPRDVDIDSVLAELRLISLADARQLSELDAAPTTDATTPS